MIRYFQTPFQKILMQLVNSKDNYIRIIIEMKNIFDVSEKSKLNLLKYKLSN